MARGGQVASHVHRPVRRHWLVRADVAAPPDGRIARALDRQEAAYLSACASRQALRVVSRPTITDGRFFQATLLGLDNRIPLPPFMPVQRYEDGVFRIALRACFEDAYFAHLPWACPPRQRRGPPLVARGHRRTAAWIRTGELMVHCVRSYAPPPGADAEARLRSLGAHLVSLGDLPARRLQDIRPYPASSRRRPATSSTWRRCFASTGTPPRTGHETSAGTW